MLDAPLDSLRYFVRTANHILAHYQELLFPAYRDEGEFREHYCTILEDRYTGAVSVPTDCETCRV